MTDVTDPRTAAQGLQGQILEGRYRLDELDDATASRSLWRGTDQQKNRPVTIQLYVGDDAPSERTLTAALLRQPEHIPTGFASPQGSGKMSGGTYAIYDPFAGKARYLARHLTESQLHVSEAIELGYELAGSLQALHANGWSHGALGLDTIVLIEESAAASDTPGEDAPGPRTYLRIVDVGLAGQAAVPRGHAIRDDIVAVGRVLRRLHEVAVATVAAPVPGSTELEDIVKRATETSGAPFPNMGALQEALRGALAGGGKRARGGGRRVVSTAAFAAMTAPQKPPEPAPLIPDAVAAVVLPPDPEPSGPSPLPFTPPPAQPPAPPKKQPESPVVYVVAGLLVAAIAFFLFVLIPGPPNMPKMPEPVAVADAGPMTPPDAAPAPPETAVAQAEVEAPAPEVEAPDTQVAAADTEAPDTEAPDTNVAGIDTEEPDTFVAVADTEPAVMDTLAALTPDKDTEPVDTTPAPKDTEKPKDTEPPKDTEKPKDTEPPKDTEKPKDTEPRDTEKPKDTTPPKDTAPPVDTTPPKDTAPPPVDTTPPKDTAPPPVDTAPPPVDTTAPPRDTTPPPVDTTPPPRDTTPPPVDTARPTPEVSSPGDAGEANQIPVPSLPIKKVVTTLNDLVSTLKLTESVIAKNRTDGKGAGVTGALQGKLLSGWTEGTPITLLPRQMYYTAMRMFNEGASTGAVSAAIAASGGK